MNSKSFPSQIPVGSVVLFEQDGEPLIALVQGLKKDKYLLYSERARTLELSATRLDLFEIRAQSGLITAEQQQFLVALKAQCQNIAESINLEELWEVVSESPRLYAADELANLSFTKASEEQKLATKILLLKDRAYFKRDKDQFLARPATVVAELKKAQAAQANKLRVRKSLVEFFKNKQSQAQAVPQEFTSLIDLMKRYAVSAELSPSEEREAKEIIELALEALNKDNSRVGPIAAYIILEELNIFGARTNPAWERSALPGVIVFEEKDLEVISPVVASSDEEIDQGRLDFTALDVFTIDDISTRDMDDALSLESTDFGYKIGIHISDVSAEIALGSKLDSKVAHRLSSIYLPERTIHMLPEELSLKRLSLLESERRRAMSLILEVDKSYKIIKTTLSPSWVKVKRRWTYDQVDNLLESAESELSTFYEIAGAFEAERIEKGAMHVQKTEISVSVDENGTVALKEIDEQSPARLLIAEMAVLMNRVVAEFCRDKKIPVIFRGQPESIPDHEEEVKPEEGRARDHFIRVRLKRSEASLQAMPHAGLGLAAYLQITSPIRRYVDLINQRQLMAHLAGRALPYSYEVLESLLQQIEAGVFQINKVSKESKRFWMLRYLEQRITKNSGPEGRKISGVVVRVNGKLPLVELDEVFFASFVKSARRLTVGEKVQVVIAAIDARDDYLRLEVQ